MAMIGVRFALASSWLRMRRVASNPSTPGIWTSIRIKSVHFSKDGEYLGQWGNKGSGDGQFNLVHDVALASHAGSG